MSDTEELESPVLSPLSPKRNTSQDDTADESNELNSSGYASGDARQRHGPIAEGVLANGTRFGVPETIAVMRALITPRCLKTSACQLWLFSCFCIFPSSLYLFWNLGPGFFAFQFVVWRLAYNVGIGLILHKQSNQNWFVENIYKGIVLKSPFLTRFVEDSVVFRDPNLPKFKLSDYPHEFSAWMFYRFIVNIILANDLLSFFMLVIINWKQPFFLSGWLFGSEVPSALSVVIDLGLYVLGLAMIVFATWSKADAHRIIGDYAWYWGDFFFLLDKDLVFDGVFDMFPHPMYSVGYFFMYGFSFITKSPSVFYWSVFGHLCQIAFLAVVENPHIDKTYNSGFKQPTPQQIERDRILYNDEQGYFESKELVVLKNFQLFRAADFTLLLLLGQSVIFTIYVTWNDAKYLTLVHFAFWRLFLTFGLGVVLKIQSRTQYFTKFFGSSKKAFHQWKRVYNTAVTMTNVTFFLTTIVHINDAAQLFNGSAGELRYTCCVVGILLVLLNVYVSLSVYDTVGDFGYFYGDFFIDEVPSRLTYGGIYRYLNNPDSSMGFAGHYGMALLAASPTILVLAVVSHGMVKLFEILVERPHMRSKYGDEEVRKAGGLTAAIKKGASTWNQALKRKTLQAKLEYEKAVSKLKTEVAVKKEAYDKLKRLKRGTSPMTKPVEVEDPVQIDPKVHRRKRSQQQ